MIQYSETKLTIKQLTNALALFNTWYDNINIYVDSSLREIVIEDLLTGSVFHIHSWFEVKRCMENFASWRIALGITKA